MKEEEIRQNLEKEICFVTSEPLWGLLNHLTKDTSSLSEILEEQVDPKYYLSEKMQKRFQEYMIKKKQG